MFKMREKRKDYVGRIENVLVPYDHVPETSLSIVSKQLKLVDILIDQLKNHDLYSTTNIAGSSRYAYKIGLKQKYPTSQIASLKVNFNRFNLSLHMTNIGGDPLGTFKFRTDIIVGKEDTHGSVTSPFQFSNTADTELIEELKECFHETEVIFAEECVGYKTYTSKDDIDLNEIKFVDLCTLYCENLIISSKLVRLNYGDYTANEFYHIVDLDELKGQPGIGEKTISIIKNIYTYYGFDKK